MPPAVAISVRALLPCVNVRRSRGAGDPAEADNVPDRIGEPGVAAAGAPADQAGMANKIYQIPNNPSFIHSEVGCQGVVLGQAVRFTNALRIRTGGAL